MHHLEIGKTACYENKKGLKKTESIFVGDRQDKKAYLEANALLKRLKVSLTKGINE